jgi:hypothetical protein
LWFPPTGKSARKRGQFNPVLGPKMPLFASKYRHFERFSSRISALESLQGYEQEFDSRRTENCPEGAKWNQSDKRAKLTAFH